MREFVRECDDHFRTAQRLCFMTPAAELQRECISDLHRLATHANAMKENAISTDDEDSANAVLSLEETIKAFICELSMWVNLKEPSLSEDTADRAWNNLVHAQQHIAGAMRAHSIASGLSAVSSRLLLLEKALFPSQMFSSAGMIIKKAECSICHEEFGTCDHLKGLPYMGKLCARIITEAEMLESSYVSDPADKTCRILQVISDNVSTHTLTKRSTQVSR